MPWLALGGLLAGWSLTAMAERRSSAQTLARERRRMAADVHDLIMQDLSLALANARVLADDHAHAAVVISAGERALAGARVVISGLTGPPPPGSHQPIARAIEASVQAAARDTQLTFDARGVPHSAHPDRPTRDALLHVAREAVTNATKHAGANAIEVTLEYTGRWRLTVRDEGSGFDATGGGNGFGLSSMRAHVHALGGVLHVASAVEGGTTVEALLP